MKQPVVRAFDFGAPALNVPERADAHAIIGVERGRGLRVPSVPRIREGTDFDEDLLFVIR